MSRQPAESPRETIGTRITEAPNSRSRHGPRSAP
jgi:hypothetical protein